MDQRETNENLNGIANYRLFKASAPIFAIYFLAPWVIRFDRISQTTGWLIDLALRVLLPGLFMIMLARRWKVYPAVYGLALNSGNMRRDELIGASIICFFAYLSYVPLENIVRWSLGVGFDSISNAYPTPLDGPIRMLTMIYDVAVPPFFEEVLYRGILAAVIVGDNGSFMKKILYVAVSSILFGNLHSSSFSNIIATTYLGAVSCLIYLWLRNLWPLIFAHLFTNLLIFSWTASRTA